MHLVGDDYPYVHMIRIDKDIYIYMSYVYIYIYIIAVQCIARSAEVRGDLLNLTR